MDKNLLYYGDNLDILREHIPDESIDLIYLDPPFNSKRNYNVIYDGAAAQAEAFQDTWSLRNWRDEEKLIFEDEPQRYNSIHNLIGAFEKLLINSNPALFAYLVNMSIRLVELHRVLKKTGSLYLHCDSTAGHYLKLALDAVFGIKNFQNEIIWKRATAHNMKTKGYIRVNDTIYFFTKSSKYLFNEFYTPYGQAQLSRYKDENGRLFKAENLTFSTKNPSRQFEWRGAKPPPNRSWGASIEQLEKWWAEGRILSKKNGSPRLDGLKIYLDETKGGNPLSALWDDIERIGNTSKERLGYQTQKPEALLERIIKASSNEGDIVLDPFCGCGTTVAVAQRLNRGWIGIDITFLAVDLIRQRLLDHYYRNTLSLNEIDAKERFGNDILIFGIPKDLEGARQLAAKTEGDRTRKEFEKWAVFSVGGVYSEVKGADSGMDGYMYINDWGANNKPKRIKCPIQVKSGHVGVSQIRDFSHVIDREKAPLGIFITIEPPSKKMLEEIIKMPKARLKAGQVYDKVIVIQVQDIMDDNLPLLPIQRATKKAARVNEVKEQLEIFER